MTSNLATGQSAGVSTTKLTTIAAGCIAAKWQRNQADDRRREPTAIGRTRKSSGIATSFAMTRIKAIRVSHDQPIVV